MALPCPGTDSEEATSNARGSMAPRAMEEAGSTALCLGGAAGHGPEEVPSRDERDEAIQG